MNERIIDAEIVEETSHFPPSADNSWAEYGAKIETLFAAEPASVEDVVALAKSKFGYGENLTRNALTWLEARGRATTKLRGGVLYWGKPVDVRKLVDAAASVAEVVSVSVEALGGEKAARVMRDAASAARTVPAAVEGIRREAKPAIDAFTRLGAAAKEAGFFRVREPLDVQIAKRREEAAKKSESKEQGK
jgi:hypothetical protein